MPAPAADRLENLVLVAGHAIYTGRDFQHPELDGNWCLQSFQRGEPPFYVEHIRAGVDEAQRDPAALLVFSGGQTRLDAGPRSEAQSYWNLAQHFAWWSSPAVSVRATTEEFARDSLENLLFSICRFHEWTGRTPRRITVVSWAFKERRFGLHREALRFPESRFRFRGANQPEDLAAARAGEAHAVTAFEEDPYGVGEVLGGKRVERNPFRRVHPYAQSCPALEGLLRHAGPELYRGELPWA